jgi:phosphoglucomutase
MINPMPTAEALKAAMKGMILSPSGWRGIMNESGEEENAAENPAPEFLLIAAAAAVAFARFLAPRSIKTVVVGRDTRPTGKALSGIMIKAFLASGCSVRYAGITAAPELFAYSGNQCAPDGGSVKSGFCYISASHNPIGHNGFKFGLDDGGVLEGTAALSLISVFTGYMAQPDTAENIAALLEKAQEQDIKLVYAESEKTKNEALAAYGSFIKKVIAGTNEKAASVMEAIIEGLKKFPLGIAADFNGSARTVSVDEALFTSLGARFSAINGKPGEIAHAIIPEGDSLSSCRAFLEELHAKDPCFVLGYMPDCDGDRGNLVIWDDEKAQARILDAQEVFALACVAELAHLAWAGELDYTKGNVAIAVNGPTSCRVDCIAKAFGAKVFRCEVGEANVVNLARKLRKDGYVVRILGEGSNGGNITHPSSVRDPLATVFALVKLFAIRSGGAQGRGFFDCWLDACAATAYNKDSGKKSGDFTLADIIASLPRFFTTGVSEPEAKLNVAAKDHALLKNRYQVLFERAWDERKEALKRQYGIYGWEARACIGTEELRNLSAFGDAQTGGLKIVFTSKEKAELAFMWMRGSKTEPVFRIMADAADPALERELITWQRELTLAADLPFSKN